MTYTTTEPIIFLPIFIEMSMLLVASHAMQETYSEHGERNDIRGLGNIVEITVAIPATLVVLQTTLIGTLSLISLLAAPIAECLTSMAI